MGEESIEQRSADTVKMLNYGFNTYKVNLIKSKEEVIGKVKVEKGKKEYAEVTLLQDATELLNINSQVSKYDFKLEINKIVAPVKKGDVIGNVKIFDQNNNLINTVDITIKSDVLKANIWDLFVRNLKYNVSMKKI